MNFGRLQDIQEEMLDLLDEAKDLISQANPAEYNKARFHWISQVETAIGGSSTPVITHTMNDTINVLESEDD